MHGWLLRITTGLLAVTVYLAQPAATQQPGDIPTPEQFFGFLMGENKQLAHWDQMVDYFHTIADQSDRVVVKELGKTTLGHPYLLIVVSTPDTIRDLPRYQAMQKQLADPRLTNREQADQIAHEGKAVVLIGANVHSTEVGTSQVMNDLVYQLATEQSAWMDHLLDNTIVLLIPSQNPDGQRMVVDWSRKNIGTPYEDSPLPELYHTYAGHDNNRDSYMLTQVETQYLNRVTYQEWLPEVYLDIHLMGNNSARIFVPPFKNPLNPNVDPLVWSQVNLLGQAMATKLHEANKPGVIWGEMYSGYWQGANNTTPWWHNMIGLLTEIASPNLDTSVRLDKTPLNHPAELSRSGILDTQRGGSALRSPSRDIQYRMNYPRPWLGGSWTPTDVIEYGRLATLGLIEGVANNRATLKRNFYVMNRRAIDRFSEGNPYAFLVPANQHDPAAVAKLLRLLQAEMAEVELATAPFVADEQTYAAGTYVLRLAQPFGRWIKDILEPQVYPDIRWPYRGAPFDKPYDVTAWSLGMLMGVETIQIDKPFDATLTALAVDVQPPPGAVLGKGQTYLLSHQTNQSFVALNRLLTSGASIGWAREGFALSDGQYEVPGTMLIRDADRPDLERLAKELHLQIISVDPPEHLPVLMVQMPRLAIYEPWGGNIDAGWTRWVLEQHEFPYVRLRHTDVQRVNLLDRVDVIILPEISNTELIHGTQQNNVRPEHRGGIGAQGIRNLRRFITEGGTLITLGNSANFATEHLDIHVANKLKNVTENNFYGPGSIVRVSVDTMHPIGYGMPVSTTAMFVNNGALIPIRRNDTLQPTVVVQYPNGPLLKSGWMLGEERLRGTGAVVEVPLGKGRVILHTFRVQHRGQTWSTFKLLFNSIFYGPAVSGRTSVQTSLGEQ